MSSSISKIDELSARVSVKVPQPDSLVEVRVSPPDSNFQVKVSPGDEVIELLIQPGSSMVEVRISPPRPSELDEDENRPPLTFDDDQGRPSGDDQAGFTAVALTPEPVSRVDDDLAMADEAPLVEAEELAAPEDEAMEIMEPAAITRPDLSAVAGPMPESLLAPPAFETAGEPDELDQPDPEETVAVEAQTVIVDEFDLPDPEPAHLEIEAVPAETTAIEFDESSLADQIDPLAHLSLESDETHRPQAPQAIRTPVEPVAGQTLEWVPVHPDGAPVDDDQPIAPEVIGAAAQDALARLNLAVREELAAIESVSQPSAPTSAATYVTSADSTIMVEMYDDYEPGPNPADTVTPPPEEDLMDLSSVEKDDDLAIEPIDMDDLGDLDLERSHFAETKTTKSVIKARPMAEVIPANTVVPES